IEQATTGDTSTVVGATNERGRVTVHDGDGTPIEIILRGDGQVTIDRNAAGGLDLFLTDTSERSRLTIRTKGRGGDDRADIVNVYSFRSIRSIDGRKVDLSGDLWVGGSLGRLRLGDMAPGQRIDVGVMEDMPEDGTPLDARLGDVSDVTLISNGPIASLRAEQWADRQGAPDRVRAPRIDRLRIRNDFEVDLVQSAGGAEGRGMIAYVGGNLRDASWHVASGIRRLHAGGVVDQWHLEFDQDIRSMKLGRVEHAQIEGTGPRSHIGRLDAYGWASGGLVAGSLGTLTMRSARTQEDGSHFGADLTLFDRSADWGLRRMTVPDWIDGSAIRIASRIGSITTGGLRDSVVFAGVAGDDTLPDTAERLDPLSSIASLRVNGRSTGEPLLINARVAASTITRLDLREVDTTNEGIPFGAAARFITQYRRDGARPAAGFDGGWLDLEDDFEVRIV
ncbi:MAG: hypothetical protein CMJ18_09995, partial [Phycisphaeraceae bacterium]|nr:hypothetical protein [Phycisphaeraceae bacterium]